MPNVKISHVVQRSPDLDPSWKKLAPDAVHVASVESLIEAGGFDVAVIATPDATHHAYGLALLKAGFHVLVDKPLAQSLDQATELLDEARKLNKLCMPYQNRRYDADFLTVRKLLEGGSLGRLVDYEAHFDRYRLAVVQSWKELERGSLDNLGPHLIDQAIALFGAPSHVWADIAVTREDGVEDDAFEVHLFYEGAWAPSSSMEAGAHAEDAASGRLRGLVPPPRKAVLKSAMIAPDNGLRYVLHGTRGSFVKHGIDGQEAALRAPTATGADPILPRGEGWGSEAPQWHGRLTSVDPATGQTSSSIVPSESGCYGRLYEGVLAAIACPSPTEAQEVSPRQALATMAVIDAAKRSAREQRRVPLEVPSC